MGKITQLGDFENQNNYKRLENSNFENQNELEIK